MMSNREFLIEGEGWKYRGQLQNYDASELRELAAVLDYLNIPRSEVSKTGPKKKPHWSPEARAAAAERMRKRQLSGRPDLAAELEKDTAGLSDDEDTFEV